MNFSKILCNTSTAKGAFKKLSKLAKALQDAYANLTEPSEEIITGNYFGIIKCNQILSDLKTLNYISKDQKKYLEIKADVKKTLNSIKSNLNTIALELQPKEYITDLDNIIQILNDRNIQLIKKDHFIFPKGNQIIIGTTMDCGEKQIVFTTVYSDSNLEKYLNILQQPIELGNYNFGLLLNNNSEDALDVLLKNEQSLKIDNLIKNSSVFDNYIKASVNDRINIKKAFNLLTDHFKDKLEKSYLYNTDLLFKFKSNLTDKEVNEITSILKLKNNDKYKFVALLKE